MTKKFGHITKIEHEEGHHVLTFVVRDRKNPTQSQATLRLLVTPETVDRAIELIGHEPLEITYQNGVVIGVDQLDENQPDVDVEAMLRSVPAELKERLKLILSSMVEIERRTGEVRDEEFYILLEKESGINRSEAIRLVEQLIKGGVIYLKAGRLAFPPVQYY